MKRKWIPAFLLLSAFFLFACGLSDRFLGGVGQEINPEMEEPAPIEPIATETMAAEVEPTPEETLAAEEMADPTAGPQALDQSACYHPFFPVVDGASWTYDDSFDSGYTLRIEETGDDTFTMTQIMSDEETELTVDWYCSEEGLLRGTFAQVDLFSQATVEEGDPEIIFETFEWEGETLPAPELMEIGYTWTSTYTLRADVNLQGFMQTMQVQVSIDHAIGAIEAVTVPAGTFPEAYRVDSTGSIEMLMIMGETSNPLSSFEFNFSTWYVKGLGMVKSGSEFSGISSATELIDSTLLK
jgi:hypothetical protein